MYLNIFCLQTFILDHEVIRKKLRETREHCCPGSKYKYAHIEEDIISTPSWPPVGHSPVTAVYHEDSGVTLVSESDRMLPNTSDCNNCYSSASAISLTADSAKTSNAESEGLLNSVDSDMNILVHEHKKDNLELLEEKGENSGNRVDTNG